VRPALAALRRGKTHDSRGTPDSMTVRMLFCLASLLLCGCTSNVGPGVPAVPTLAGDRRLPAGDIERFFSPTQWQKLRDLGYDGFVIMDAQVRADGSLRVGKVRDSYPDASWHTLARQFGEEARLRAASVGSHIDPPAEVFVVFFKRAFDGNLALIFARQKSDPAPGMTQKAVYLHTRHY
jgi:hypothetical protein